MKEFVKVSDLRGYISRYAGQKVGLIPTMGYLHEGHLSLLTKAKEMADLTVVSIFVNPLQFGPNEDYGRYPRDPERDQQLLEEYGADVLFAPTVAEMYPSPTKTKVVISDITERLCGASRPGHFEGVATVVNKLFNIVQPDFAFFGLKDAQQVAVVEQMVKDLDLSVKIVPCSTMREKDGLAMSSRNVYLSEEERRQAPILYQSLRETESAIKNGERDADRLRHMLVDMISSQPTSRIDYVEVLTYPDLQPVENISGKRIILALAVWFGRTRLIDNLIMQV